METVFDTVLNVLTRSEHEMRKGGIVAPRITVELLPNDWMEFKRTLEYWAFPQTYNDPSYNPDEVILHGHKVKIYTPKR